MAWMETNYSEDTHFRWKIKRRLEHLGSLLIIGDLFIVTRRLMCLLVNSNIMQDYDKKERKCSKEGTRLWAII